VFLLPVSKQTNAPVFVRAVENGPYNCGFWLFCALDAKPTDPPTYPTKLASGCILKTGAAAAYWLTVIGGCIP
jgi:hypothetical protein